MTPTRGKQYDNEFIGINSDAQIQLHTTEV